MLRSLLLICLMFTSCYVEQEIQVHPIIVEVINVEKRLWSKNERYVVTLIDKDGVKYYMFFYDIEIKIGQKFVALIR